ncbi:MAG: hypothetical protein SFX73_33075 [Kofleriaceae bacterium]|nr:hypothetical protein [Kofleriaceae bacterium]
MRVLANLDCEARWAGVTLPRAVGARISLYASLLAAFSEEPAEIWAPVAVDARRLCEVPGWQPPRMHVGAPAQADLRWAEPLAREVNDRRFALALGRARGVALPGTRVLASVDELADVTGASVVKAAWTSAGRDRCRGDGPPTTEQRTRISRLLAMFGALVFEPWMQRELDVGVCARVTRDGSVTAEPPHGLRTDTRGGFVGVELAPPALAPDERALLAETAEAAGRALFDYGYAGPYALDAFVYRGADGMRRFHPLCEINARYTFGWVARALGRRFGVTRLGFDAPPPGATVLIAPAGDGVTAWIA